MPDLFGDIFVQSPSTESDYDFGYISNDIARSIECSPGPIRLKYGYPGPKGFGLNHILGNERRMHQLKVNGFSRFESFAYSVCQAYGTIRDGGAGKLVMVKTGLIEGNLLDLRLILQFHQGDEDHWGITSGIIAKVSREPALFEREAQKGGSVPTPGVAERPRFETLSLPKTRKAGDNGS